MRSRARMHGHDGAVRNVTVALKYLEEPQIARIQLTAIFAALADSTRLRIVRTLSDGKERSCSEFETTVSKATAAHHFKTLRMSGLTRTRLVGTRRFVSLRIKELNRRFPGLLDVLE